MRVLPMRNKVSSESQAIIQNYLKRPYVEHAAKVYRFYYVDERQVDGGPTIPVNGPAAGETYVNLAEQKEQGPWDYTFVKEKGYVEFK